MSTDVGRTRSSVNSPLLRRDSVSFDDLTDTDRHEHTTPADPTRDRTAAQPHRRANPTGLERASRLADGRRALAANVLPPEHGPAPEPDGRVQHRLRGDGRFGERFVDDSLFAESKPSLEYLPYARVADDDSLAPSRTRHPVVTSPMSAEAS